MDPFKLLSQFKDIKGQAAALDAKLKALKARGESGGVSIVLNGRFELVELTLPQTLPARGPLEKSITAAHRAAEDEVKGFIKKELGFLSSLGLDGLFRA